VSAPASGHQAPRWPAKARATLRDAYYASDAVLHPLRRWRAERMLRQRGLPPAVLFVCHGNVCRSPYAEFAFRNALSSVESRMVRVGSAGFIGPGRQPPSQALAAAARRGVDMRSHSSELIQNSALRDAALVVVMSAQQARALRRGGRPRTGILVLGDLDPQAISRRTIEDPWNKDASVFDDCYARIDRCVQRLADLLTSRSTDEGR
jgi:protein-tyrosine phosphatase